MAVLWPRTVPRSIRDDFRREAEMRVYDRLSKELDDSFTVFYTKPWLGLDRQGNERDGECDFLVAHAEHGILAIEVKGGGIEYDPERDQWISIDRHGFRHKIKDPVEQARKAKHEIRDRLKKSRRWSQRYIHESHGVIFPHSAVVNSDLGTDRPRRIFCSSKQLHSALRDWISERMKEGRRPENCNPLGRDGIAALEDLLAKPFTLHFVIGAALSEAEEDFHILEPSQYQILETISDIPRALVRGGAGTGKTVVAIEEAIRSAKSGKRTLLTCYSRPLAMNLEKKLKDIPNLTVSGFHSLCGKMAKSAGIPIQSNNREKELYDCILPDALCQAMESQAELMWDTIIVDEGQDFHIEWWIAIDACLKSEGMLRVFMDSNQQLYDSAGISSNDLNSVPVRLSRNLRNTKRIHEAATKHYVGPDVTADGPEGLAVKWTEAEAIQEKIKLAYKELRHLVFHEEVSPGDIAVLVNNISEKNDFLSISTGTSISITDAENLAFEDVVIDTVRRFKGLERPVVILIVGSGELEKRELAYVAFTRARSYLSVICTNKEKKYLTGAD